MKRGSLIIVGLFAVTLAVVIGLRVSADALAMIVGVILGVLAGVPTTFLLTWAVLRGRLQGDGVSPAASQQPPVVLINATDRPPAVSTPVALPAASTLPTARRWTMVGEIDTDD